MTFRNTFGEAYMKGFDAHIDRQQAAHTDAQDDDESLAQAREAAIEEMAAALVAGRDVQYGGRNGYALTIDSRDVRDEIDGDALRHCANGVGTSISILWAEAARRVCERHVDEYLEWRTTV